MQFTIDQIHEAFSKVKDGTDFPQLVQDLKEIGVNYYDNYVSDGKTKYFGANNYFLEANAKYPIILINKHSSASMLKHAITIHQNGDTDYPTFCKQAAEAGVEKWTTHMIEMIVTYFDKEGNKLIVESIPLPEKQT